MHVYADNAATTKISAAALQAMMPAFETYYGNPSSLHSVGQDAKELLENARERIARCIGAEPREIYFTSGGSEADNQAILSSAKLGAKSFVWQNCSGAPEITATMLRRISFEGNTYESSGWSKQQIEI